MHSNQKFVDELREKVRRKLQANAAAAEDGISVNENTSSGTTSSDPVQQCSSSYADASSRYDNVDIQTRDGNRYHNGNPHLVNGDAIGTGFAALADGNAADAASSERATSGQAMATRAAPLALEQNTADAAPEAFEPHSLVSTWTSVRSGDANAACAASSQRDHSGVIATRAAWHPHDAIQTATPSTPSDGSDHGSAKQKPKAPPRLPPAGSISYMKAQLFANPKKWGAKLEAHTAPVEAISPRNPPHTLFLDFLTTESFTRSYRKLRNAGSLTSQQAEFYREVVDKVSFENSLLTGLSKATIGHVQIKVSGTTYYPGQFAALRWQMGDAEPEPVMTLYLDGVAIEVDFLPLDNPKGAKWVGYYDTVGFNEFRKTKR